MLPGHRKEESPVAFWAAGKESPARERVGRYA